MNFWTLRKNAGPFGGLLSKVRKILDVLVAEGKVFDVKSDTSVDEIIQHFNQKGVYYEATRHNWPALLTARVQNRGFIMATQEVWAERYQTYCKSYSLSNWQARKSTGACRVVPHDWTHPQFSMQQKLLEVGISCLNFWKPQGRPCRISNSGTRIC